MTIRNKVVNLTKERTHNRRIRMKNIDTSKNKSLVATTLNYIVKNHPEILNTAMAYDSSIVEKKLAKRSINQPTKVDRQSQVICSLKSAQLTRNEIAAQYDTYPSNFSNPVNALLIRGLIEVVGTKRDEQTGKTVEILSLHSQIIGHLA